METELVIGGWFRSRIISKLIDTASSYLENHPKWHGGMKEEVEELRKALPQIQVIMKVVEEGRFEKQKEWLQQLEDAVDEAYDVLDDIEYTRREQNAIAGEDKEKKVSAFASRLKKMSIKSSKKRTSESNPTIPTTSERLRTAVLSLNDVAKMIRDVIVPPGRESGPFLSEKEVLGRDKVKEELIELLIRRDSSNIIPIVGCGGVGKTTLAQVVYNDKRIREHFSPMMWMCVSNFFDLQKMIASISEVSAPSPYASLDTLQEYLKEALVSKRFLLVLDDVTIFSEDRSNWEVVVAALKHGETGSKILITTRMDSITKMVGDLMEGSRTPPVTVKGLQEDDLLSLFTRHAFAGVGNLDDYTQLQLIGKLIAKKLGNLPLAAKTVGRLLNSNLHFDYWAIILNEDVKNFDRGDNKIMRLPRYQHLPTSLQGCFRFCSIYPRGYAFEKKELIYMWLALGFIQQSHHKQGRLEEIGQEYFDILHRKGFFAPLSENKEKYIMNDSMHDLAQFVSQEECWRLDDEDPQKIPSSIRHLSIIHQSSVTIERVPHLKNLRTLFIDAGQRDDSDLEHAIDDMLDKQKGIRVLKLSGYRRDELPGKIGGLFHLRLLRLEKTNVRIWPNFLGKLHHLQVICKDRHHP